MHEATKKNRKKKQAGLKTSEVPTLARSVMILWAAPTLHPKIATKSDIVQVRRAAIVLLVGQALQETSARNRLCEAKSAKLFGRKTKWPLAVWIWARTALTKKQGAPSRDQEWAGRNWGEELIEPFLLVYLWAWDVAGCTGWRFLLCFFDLEAWSGSDHVSKLLDSIWRQLVKSAVLVSFLSTWLGPINFQRGFG